MAVSIETIGMPILLPYMKEAINTVTMKLQSTHDEFFAVIGKDKSVLARAVDFEGPTDFATVTRRDAP